MFLTYHLKNEMSNIAIIIAGGSGNRMGQDIPKQFLNVGEKPIIIYTLEVFQKHPNIDGIIVVCKEGWENVLSSYIKQFNITKISAIVKGGKCGQESIKNGLDKANEIYNADDIVLIHDAIRPMVSEETISDNIAKCTLYGNATTVIPCTTVVLKKQTNDYSKSIVDRDMVMLTQTPQAFILKEILSAHDEAQKIGITDSVASCTLYSELGRKVYFSAGSETNIKLTRPADIKIFKALLHVKKSDWMKE